MSYTSIIGTGSYIPENIIVKYQLAHKGFIIKIRTKNEKIYQFILEEFSRRILLESYLLVYITIEKYTIFQLKSIPVLIVCEDKKSYLNAG